MTEPAVPLADVAPRDQALNPFGYWPALRSRIAGLGGPEDGPDQAYVFHSSYVPVNPGTNIARLSFEGLRARSGVLAIRIFRFRPNFGSAIDEVRATSVRLNTMANAERPAVVAFEAQADAQYAVVGYVLGDCEAAAKGLKVEIAYDPDGTSDPERRRSHFGRRTARVANELETRRPPNLAHPVSQGFTPDQLIGPVAAGLIAGIPDDLPDRERWEIAYITRVFEVYGRLVAGAVALGIGHGADLVADRVRDHGLSLTTFAMTPGITPGTAITQSGGAPGTETLDAIWVRSGLIGLQGIAALSGEIDELLGFVRPAGLAVLMVDLSLGVRRGSDEAGRNALNRLVLTLVAEGHIVAQLRLEGAEAGPPDDRSPFGFVVRKKLEAFG